MLSKINNIYSHSVVYVPLTDFDTWLDGDTAVFQESGVPANTINVSVVAQLPTPITGTEAVSYQFSEIVEGADEKHS